ncbi:M13 family metallopeptidase [Flavisphingopyxis soli]
MGAENPDVPAAAEAAAAETPAVPAAQYGSFGFDEAGMDRGVAPGDNFYEFANGTWVKNTAIPADKSNFGMFSVLDDLSRQRTKEILDEAKDDTSSKIGNAYSSFLDEAAVEAKGLAPIQPWLTEIEGLKSKADYPALAAKAAKMGVGTQFAGYVGQDDKDPNTYIMSFYQSGIGMPDRDYYLSTDAEMVKTRTAYLAHLTNMFTLAKMSDAAARAKALLAFETQIAKAQWSRVDSRDATKTYNKMTVAALDKATPGFDFSQMIAVSGATGVDTVLVAQPSAFTGIAKAIQAAPLSVLKDALIVRSLDGYADYLPKAFVDENFAFYGTTLSGTPELEPRWKRAVSFTTGALSDDVSKIYVAKYFPPETKAAADQLVKNILAAMGRRIDGLEWMSDSAKLAAHAKLASFTPKIGYPDKWRDLSGLKIERDDLLGNAMRSNAFDYAYNINKLGKPIYRWEWGMTPMTINAYANFGMVEIVFPAAILQPPFFDPNADPAVNYGGIGAVIGHELSHHFDDQGAKYDKTGKLTDWWTPQDVANFKGLTEKLAAQYDQYEPLPGMHVNGHLTMGENIADLAGLTVAYDAYKASLNGQAAPVLDGFTGDQRFYLGWAQVWRRNYREANLRQRLVTDPHSPSEQRVDTVRNLDPWYSAYNPTTTSRLYLPPQQRVRIW